MELIPDSPPARFPWKDAVILVKRRASVLDKFQLDMLGERKEEGGKLVAKFSQIELGRLLVRLFVVGWEGVTMDGKDVPYSYELLEKSLPADRTEDFFLSLYAFIVKETDIFKRDIELKKDSPLPSRGSPRETASTASGKTAKGSPVEA